MKKKIKILRNQFTKELEDDVNLALKDLPSDTKVTFTSYEFTPETGRIGVMKVAILEYLYDQVEEEINNRMESFGKEKMAEKFANFPEKWWDANELKWVTRNEVMRTFAENLVGSQEWKDELAKVTKEVKENA